MITAIKQQDQVDSARTTKPKRKTPKHKPKPLPFTRRWITINEAASLLSLAPNSVYRLIKRGVIIPARLGRTVRIDVTKLERQLEASSRQ